MQKTYRVHDVNRLLAERDQTESLAWSRGPLGQIQALQPDIKTDFGKWLDFMMSAYRLTNLDLAKAYNRFRHLRPRRDSDERCKRLSATVHPPKKEISEYRRGLRVPGRLAAYQIGRALEQILIDTRLRESRSNLRRIGATPDSLPETVVGATCSLDGLVAAGYWADAIAVVGAFFGKAESAGSDWETDFGDTLRRQVHGETLPARVYPELDKACAAWIRDADIAGLPPRFAAAYILAKSPEPIDQIAAKDILEEWEPRQYRDV